MKTNLSRTVLTIAALALGTGVAHAERYQNTIDLFKNARESAHFFKDSFAYAVFPTIGQGGFVVGAAHGRGRVYSRGARVGDTTVTQLSVGWQVGGQAYSQIIFFKDKRALDEFESGSFEFAAGASVTAITAAAGASAGTAGADAGASAGMKDAVVAGTYSKGMAVFTIVKGGLMVDASLQGERFSFKARSAT
jgi:lipid-binding SYLF domain-containing protein